jgi:hypothetical protein
MGLRGRVEKLERESDASYQTLCLPDGTRVRYTFHDAMAAVRAVLGREEHWLVPYVLLAGVTTGLLGLVRALEVSCARVEREDGKGVTGGS